MQTQSVATTFELMGETFRLFPHKAIFWDRYKILLIADLHFGKAAHFRKEGIAVPPSVSEKNWAKLTYLLVETAPERVLFLGDLFHSKHNEDCERFGRFLKKFPDISYELVLGNHDILDTSVYEGFDMVIHDPVLEISPFIFSHEPFEEPHDELYNLAGHIHPAVKFRGTARQGLKLPCFYFSKMQGILPSFGSFTGNHSIKPKKEDDIFVVVEDKVMKI